MGHQVTKALQQSPALVSGLGHVLSPNQKRLLLLFQDVSRVRLAALLLKQFAEYRSLPRKNEVRHQKFTVVLCSAGIPRVSLEESSQALRVHCEEGN